MSLKVISISDLHIGHHKVPPEHALANLRTYLYPLLNDDLDILFIVGDVYETIVSLNSNASYAALTFIHEIRELSNKHDFLIRVTTGTKEHDRDQLKHFNVDKEKYPNIMVADQMMIEYIEKYNIHVLYIPDDLPYKEAQSEAIRKIKEYGLSQVDICCLHGFCKHEIPPHVPIQPLNLFDADVLMQYVKGPILKGHVHKKGIYKRVIGNGSFERDRHGHEETKGFFLVDIKNDFTFTFKFIENKNTIIFKDIVLSEEDVVSEFKTKVEQVLTTETSQKIYIRIVCSKEVKLRFNPYDFEFNNKKIIYSYNLLTDKEVKVLDKTTIISLEDLIPVTRECLGALASEYLNNLLSPERIEQIFKAVEA